MRTEFRHIAYKNLNICNALSWGSLKAALAGANVLPTHRIADIGCAYARTSILIAENFGAELVGVDLDPVLVEGARERAAASPAAGRISIVHQTAIDALNSIGPFDGIVALGTSFPAGPDATTPHAIFTELSLHLKPGGYLVWGDLTWIAEPSEPLRQMVSISGVYASDTEWKQAAHDAGLDIVSSRLSDAEEWAQYRQTMSRDLALWLDANPDHPDAPALRKADYRIGLMYDFGAESMGFGLYVFRCPA